MIEFKEFAKIPRISRACVITEKIDGTNACICITEDGQFLTGSRTKWVTPEEDNHGFSRWVNANKEELLKLSYARGKDRKGLDKRDTRYARRARFILMQINMDKAEGKYIPK